MLEKNIFHAAFPAFLQKDIDTLCEKFPLIFSEKQQKTVQISLGKEKETIDIPYRIYSAEPILSDYKSLSRIQQQILSCFFTRHHDGFVRQRHALRILESDDFWVAPYIFYLIGEYVEEILCTLYENLRDSHRAALHQIIDANPDLYRTLHARVVSYWNCYAREKFPCKDEYVGMKLLAKLAR